MGDRVAHLHIHQQPDVGHQVAHFAHREGLLLVHLGIEDADLVHLVLAAGGHEADGVPGLDGAVHDADEVHHPAVGVVVAVEDQGLQRGVGIALGRRDALDDLLQHLIAVLAGLGTHVHGVGRVHQADDRVDLLQHPDRIRTGQVRLVQDREDLQAVLQGQVGVGQGLGLHALGGVHHQNCALAGG